MNDKTAPPSARVAEMREKGAAHLKGAAHAFRRQSRAR